MPSYKLTIEYEGTRYSGWQAQGNTPRTIQGLLALAVNKVTGGGQLGGAGRTDAGVHAAGQVAHLRVAKAWDPEELAILLNEELPHDIHIVAAAHASDEFHARHDAKERLYLYQIARRRAAFAKPFVWWVRDALDADAMRDAVAPLLGMHDFAAFSDKRMVSESTLVAMTRAEIAEAGDLLLVRLAASHFLWKMVRKLVSALVEVGRGTMAPEELVRRLAPGSEPFQPTAPPSGLFLEAVLYEGETLTRPLTAVVPVVTTLPAVTARVPARAPARNTAPGRPTSRPPRKTEHPRKPYHRTKR